jgi:hypothetical protein
VASAILVASTLLNSSWLNFQAFDGKSDRRRIDDVNHGQFLPLAFACAVTLLLQSKGQSLNHAYLDRANVALSAMWVWTYCTRQKRWYYYQASVIWTARIIQGVVLGNAPLTCALHLAVSLSDVLVYWKMELEVGSHALLGYITTQCFTGLIAAILTRSFEKLRISEAEALLEARRSDSASALVKRLLSAMSDAVVYIDSSMNILEPCPKFSTLLLHPSPSHSSLVAKQFLDFVDGDYRDSFIQYMDQEALPQLSRTESETSASPVRVLHVNLLDVNRKAFPVEIFTAGIQGFDGKQMHVVGVKEVLEDGRDRIAERDCYKSAIVNLSLMDQSENSSLSTSHADSAQGANSDDAVSAGSNDNMLGQMWFEFMFTDLLGKRMRVVESSSSLAAVFGASVQVGTDISKMLWPGVVEDILGRLEQLINHPDEEVQSVVMNIQFRPEYLKKYNMYVNSHVEFTVFHREESTHCEEDDVFDMFVLAKVRSADWTRRRRKERERKRERQVWARHASLAGAPVSPEMSTAKFSL